VIDSRPRRSAGDGLIRARAGARGHRSIRKVLALCSVILGAFWGCRVPAAETPPLIGKDAPDFVLKSNGGGNLRLSEFRGQVVLVNFWARWAGDTHREMRALDKINTTYQRAGLVVLGISVDEDARRARDFADSMKVSYPIMFDTGSEIGRDYQLAKMPVTILVDRSGVVRFSHVGFKRGDDRMYLEQIRELLRE
jgi:peroxiredoxin